MSALRYSRPGIPGTVLIPVDDGASPRIDRARSGISFTPLTEAIRPFTGMTRLEIRAKPDAPRRRAMTVVPRCGKPVMGLGRKPTGELCWRRPGHGEGCRDRAAVERDNARRRAGKLVGGKTTCQQPSARSNDATSRGASASSDTRVSTVTREP